MWRQSKNRREGYRAVVRDTARRIRPRGRGLVSSNAGSVVPVQHALLHDVEVLVDLFPAREDGAERQGLHNVEDLLDRGLEMYEENTAVSRAESLLGPEDGSQAGGGDVLETLEVED
jgi:hypothetical protein